MEQQYRKVYYPNETTMEERLFEAGRLCTRVTIPQACALIGIGIILGLFAVFVAAIGSALVIIGRFILVIAGLCVSLGPLFISLYLTGLLFLERAELLYNTRMAHECVGRLTVQAPAPTQPSKSAAAVSKPATVTSKPASVSNVSAPAAEPEAFHAIDTGWACAKCGTTNKSIYSQCKACGAYRSSDSYTPAAESVTIAPIVTPKVEAPQTAPTISNGWVCSKCGTSNKVNYGQCKHCGAYRS